MIHKWFKWWTLLTLPFVISPFIVGGMLFVEAYTDHPGRILGSLPVLFFSLLLAYSSLAYLLNSSEVVLEDDLIRVVHGPIPWKGISFRLQGCEKFFADKITEGRFTTDGVRVRFIDGTYDNVIYADSATEAQEWAEELNYHLRESPTDTP